jgi:hypothetical protein
MTPRRRADYIGGAMPDTEYAIQHDDVARLDVDRDAHIEVAPGVVLNGRLTRPAATTYLCGQTELADLRLGYMTTGSAAAGARAREGVQTCAEAHDVLVRYTSRPIGGAYAHRELSMSTSG